MLETQEGAAVKGRPHSYRVPECDLTLTYRNPDATADLVVPVHLVCNTPEDILIANIKANSLSTDREWVSSVDAHDGIAVICGGGPSLRDDLAAVFDLARGGATIFALNGAARYLADNHCEADFQVIADAREQTADLVGPAREHIFAAQVHPSLFDRAPSAKLLHVNFYEDHERYYEILDGIGKPQLIVGSHGSVGNVSLALAYAMGYRTFHIFGFDSSFRDEAGHAFPQPMNISEPVCEVEYAGKKYRCTFTMKSQADVFPRLAYELEQMGATFHVHGSGYLQDRWRGERAKTLEDRERDKYRLMWDQPSYRDYIPGLEHVDAAIEALGIKVGDGLLDFGCGSGRATKAFIDRGIKAAGIDFAPNALDEVVPFTLAALWDLPGMLTPVADWGFCTDVMEHIPPEKVDDVLSGIAGTIGLRGAYFAIDSVPDRQGLIIGQVLHMTVRPPAWWAEKLAHYFASVEWDENSHGGVFACRDPILPEQRRD